MFSWSALTNCDSNEPGSDRTDCLLILIKFITLSWWAIQVRSAILVDQAQRGNGRLGTFGATNLAKLIATRRKGTQISNPSQDVVVESSISRAVFSRPSHRGQQTDLNSLTDYAVFGLERRRDAAEEVLAALVPAAKSLNTERRCRWRNPRRTSQTM